MKEIIEQIQKNRIEGEIIRFISSLIVTTYFDGDRYDLLQTYSNCIMRYQKPSRQMRINTSIRHYLKDLYGEDPLKFDDILLDYIQKTYKPRRIIYESFY